MSTLLLASFTDCCALVINADLIAAGDQVGLACLSRAAAPATCGLDIEVPEIMVAPGRPTIVPAMSPARSAALTPAGE